MAVQGSGGGVTVLLDLQGDDFATVALQIKRIVFAANLVAACALSGVLADAAVLGAPLAGVAVIADIEEEMAIGIKLPSPS